MRSASPATRREGPLIVVTLVVLAVAAQGGAQSEAIVVDSARQAIAFVDLATGTLASRVPISLETVAEIELSPDGETILAIGNEAGKVRRAFVLLRRDRRISQGNSQARLVDSAFSPDGTSAYVLASGDSPRPSELVRIDTRTGEERRLAINAPATALGLSADGSTAVIYSRGQSGGNSESFASLTFVDLATWNESGSLALPGAAEEPIISGDLWYFVDPGEPGTGRGCIESTTVSPTGTRSTLWCLSISGAVEGKVHVIDVASRSIRRSIAVGFDAQPAGSDGHGNVFIVSRRSPRGVGQLTIVHGADVTGIHSIGRGPHITHFSPDGKCLYVAGRLLRIVDLETMGVSAGLDLPPRMIGFLVTSDARRLITVSGGRMCCRIGIFDLPAKRQLNSLPAGSRAGYVAQHFGEALASIPSVLGGGYGVSFARSESPTPRRPLAFGPDEKRVYGVDTFTNSITAVDVESGRYVINIEAWSGLTEVVSLPDANRIAAISDDRIDIIDVTTYRIDSIHLKTPSNRTLITPDQSRLIVVAPTEMTLLDMKTGGLVGRIGNITTSQILFDHGSHASSAAEVEEPR